MTQKERRIFDLDIRKLKYNIKSNKPYGLYLNFFQHLDLSYAGQRGYYEKCDIDRYVREYINYIEAEVKTSVLTLGTGMNNGEAIKKLEMIKCKELM